ncbi:hypothetical protein T310_6989, partial [Rasamsonia emersonii CBS 393.64]
NLDHLCSRSQGSKVTKKLHPYDYYLGNHCNSTTARAVPNGKEAVIPSALTTVADTRPSKPYSQPNTTPLAGSSKTTNHHLADSHSHFNNHIDIHSPLSIPGILKSAKSGLW